MEKLQIVLLLIAAISVDVVSILPPEEPKYAHHHRPPPTDFSDLPPIKSLFESNCTYKKPSEVYDEDECYDIQLNKEYNIEAILPVTPPGTNYTLFVPFIVDPSSMETTFSLEAQQKLGMVQDNENITILHKDFTVKKAEENVLGLNFLEDTLLAVDYYAKRVGMDVISQEGEHYEFNWPLETFRDVHSERAASKITENYKKLKKKFDKLQDQQLEELKNLQRKLQKKDRILQGLIEKREMLKRNQRRRRKMKEDL